MNIEVQNWNGVWSPIIKEAIRRGHNIVSGMRPDVLLEWTDALEAPQRDIIRYKSMGIPTIVMQHGIEANEDYFYSGKACADLYLAWDDYDCWLAKELGGVKDVRNVGYEYLLEEPQIPIEGIPEEFFLYVPNHFKKLKEFFQNELIETKHRAKYRGLPLVVKLHPEMQPPEAWLRGTIPVWTQPSQDDHLGKTLWLLDKCKYIYTHGKQTARILYEGLKKDNREPNQCGKIMDLIENYVAKEYKC